MEKMNDLMDLLKHEIQDLYSVEEQILEALPGMIEKASHVGLKNALSEHLKITREHKNRLDQVQQIMSMENNMEMPEKKEGLLTRLFKQSHICKGMQGILDEGEKITSEEMAPEVLDAAVIAAAQKVEHYEICGYGTARTYARELGLEQVARLLEQTLNEEYEADDRLTALAVNKINLKAERGAVKSGDRSASGAMVAGRTGKTSRETARERMTSHEPEMETASAGRKSAAGRSAKSAPAGGQPKQVPVPRGSSGGRSSAAPKKTAVKGSSSSSTSHRTSSRPSERGKSGSDRRRK